MEETGSRGFPPGTPISRSALLGFRSTEDANQVIGGPPYGTPISRSALLDLRAPEDADQVIGVPGGEACGVRCPAVAGRPREAGVASGLTGVGVLKAVVKHGQRGLDPGGNLADR